MAMMGKAYGLWLPGGCTHDQLYLRRRFRLGLGLRLKYGLLLGVDWCRGNLHLGLRGRGRGRNWRGRGHDWRGRGRGHDGLQVLEATQ